MSADARVWQLEDTGSLWAGINDWELENPPFDDLVGWLRALHGAISRTRPVSPERP